MRRLKCLQKIQNSTTIREADPEICDGFLKYPKKSTKMPKKGKYTRQLWTKWNTIPDNIVLFVRKFRASMIEHAKISRDLSRMPDNGAAFTASNGERSNSLNLVVKQTYLQESRDIVIIREKILMDICTQFCYYQFRKYNKISARRQEEIMQHGKQKHVSRKTAAAVPADHDHNDEVRRKPEAARDRTRTRNFSITHTS